MRGAVIFFVIATLATGLFQERLKVSINFSLNKANLIAGYDSMGPEGRMEAVSKFKTHKPYDYYYNHDTVDMIYLLKVKELSTLKWGVTIFFVLIHFGLGLFLIKMLDLSIVRWFVLAYIFSFASAALVYGAGWVVGLDSYSLARRVVGFLQSPLPVIVLVIVNKLDVNYRKNV